MLGESTTATNRTQQQLGLRVLGECLDGQQPNRRRLHDCFLLVKLISMLIVHFQEVCNTTAPVDQTEHLSRAGRQYRRQGGLSQT